MPKTIHCRDYEEMSSKAAQIILEEKRAKEGLFVLALPGGNSVKGTLKELAKEKNWKSTIVFMADERLVPRESGERNFLQAQKEFFSKVNGIEAIELEEGSIEDCNNKLFIRAKGNIDVIVLGVGEDGHVASLFPQSGALESTGEGYVIVDDSPKPPKRRATLSMKTIRKAGKAILLFASESKKGAYEKFIDARVDYRECPAKAFAKNAVVLTVFGKEGDENG